MKSVLRIATRKSPLALWQADYVKDALEQAHPDLTVELVPMSTKGDVILDTPLAKIGGKGLFIKELEVAMMNGEADIAVHSMKDVPMEFPEGFDLAAICERENPFDAFVSNTYKSFSELPDGAVVGTCSLRRKAQIMAERPDLVIKDLRGNVQTRLSKLDAGEYDAIILAAAGLIRLEMPERIAEVLPEELTLPAAGQGAVGIEFRAGDEETLALLNVLHCPVSAAAVIAERALSRQLGGGCQVPIAAYATVDGDQVSLTGRVASLDGNQMLEVAAQDHVDNADDLGQRLGKALIEQGADEILAEIYKD